MHKLQLQGRASITVLDLEPATADPFKVDGEFVALDPGVIVLDVSPRDALRLHAGKKPNGWSRDWCSALSDPAPVFASYRKAIEWGNRRDVEVIPVDADAGLPWRARRALDDVVKAVGADPTAVYLQAKKDAVLGPILESRRAALTASVERVLARELPRPIALTMAPFGRFVAKAVESRWGLVQAGAPGGGWPG